MRKLMLLAAGLVLIPLSALSQTRESDRDRDGDRDRESYRRDIEEMLRGTEGESFRGGGGLAAGARCADGVERGHDGLRLDHAFRPDQSRERSGKTKLRMATRGGDLERGERGRGFVRVTGCRLERESFELHRRVRSGDLC